MGRNSPRLLLRKAAHNGVLAPANPPPPDAAAEPPPSMLAPATPPTPRKGKKG